MKNEHNSRLTRRTFLQTGIVAGSVLTQGRTARSVCITPRAQVVIIRSPDVFAEDGQARADVVESMLTDGLTALTGENSEQAAWSHFIAPSSRVAVKSNVMTIPTHPELNAAIMKGVERFGTAPDHIRIWDRNNGGIRPENADPRRWNWAPGFDDGDLSRVVSWASVLINAPALKSHWLSGVAGALKNWAGAVTNINARDENVSYAIHADSCADVGCVNALPAIRSKCRLIVVDALRPLCHGGPEADPNYRWDYQGLILGTDPVAVDTVCLKIIQARRDQIRSPHWPLEASPKHITAADTKYGLGVSDPGQIDIDLTG